MSNAHTVGGEHEFPVFAYRLAHDAQGLKRLWQCPYCDHSLTFADEQEDVVEMAIASHLTRQHASKLGFVTGVRT